MRLARLGVVKLALLLCAVVVVAGVGAACGSTPSGEEALLDLFQIVVEERPHDPDSWSGLADARLLNNDVDGAIEAQQRAATLDPSNLDRVVALGQLYDQAGDAEAALSALENFTERNPTNAEAFRDLGSRAAQAGRTDLARLAYQTFLRLDPDNPDADLVRDAIAELGDSGP